MARKTKEEKAAYDKQRYRDNKSRIIAGAARYRSMHRLRLKAWVEKLKSQACMDCNGVFKPVQMQFDHRDPKIKEFGIGEVYGRCYSFDRVLLEIQKCDLVCANCHALRTEAQRLSGMFNGH